MDHKPRVAVAGASGIGKHHAKWHHVAGSQVVAFLGSTPETCVRTARNLSALFPFEGQGYTDWDSLLAECQPEIVDLCVPNELHYDLAVAAISAGCHVLCEKPLVWYPGRSGDYQLRYATAIVDKARSRGVKLGICTQYVAALPQYEALHKAVRGPVPHPRSFYAEMETLSRGRERSPAQIWVDMGPHPLSLLLAWLPEAQLDEGSLTTAFEKTEARTEFVVRTGQDSCKCLIVVRDKPDGTPARRFGINEAVADYEGRADADGIYRSVLRMDGQEHVGPDLMSLLISKFDAACVHQQEPLVRGETGLRNLKLLIRILREAGAVG